MRIVRPKRKPPAHGMCEACRKKRGNQWHEKFPQRKWALKRYGQLIYRPENSMWCCEDCNPSHAGLGLIHWNEKEFTEALGIEPRSKLLRR